MKIQCDVCHKEEASLFCSADEASLCHACDQTIHHANKLATKHKRFSLQYPTSKHTPLCDICQERRAYIFCREDRAILCTECDLPIHRANENTQKHNRFLLTGVKVGALSSNPTLLCSNSTATEIELRNSCSKPNMSSDTGSVSTSSISEYLTETIPGYCMEDLLDASFSPNGFFYKDYECHLKFQQQDLFQENMCSFPVASCSPQSQVRSSQLSTSNVPQSLQFQQAALRVKEVPKSKGAEEYYNGYTVPSVTPPLIKRSRRSR
ncbi:unnamed protein product [Lupinus luteus]|uniref:B box-type domain-containing protein n=1 Tax=Lupinus luteus TaxID=3873 RepID=A0AAV1Y6V8_LUPLU